MLIPAFQLRLKDPIQEGLAAVGRYDGKHSSLTAATSGGKIFIHSPHAREGTNAEGVKYLNINKKISAVGAGSLEGDGKDALFVGTQSDLLAYDVDENADKFFKDVPDGVNTMAFGRVGAIDENLCVVGGNCSVQGFNSEGSEEYWTVTGDNVTSLTLCDINADSQNELIVGSEDFAIRTYANEEQVAEVTEADAVKRLCTIGGTRFGYALRNGTIGVYDKITRAWRVKSKHVPTAIASFDLDGDGEPELVSGWSNGKVEVRQNRDGQTVFRDVLGSSVSAILKADYRNDGQDEIIVCSTSGEVKGFLPVEEEDRGQDLLGRNSTEDSVAELSQRKQELLYELSQYEANMKTQAQKGKGSTQTVIPTDTHVTVTLEKSPERRCCELVLSTTNDTIIKGAIVFAEQVFEHESLYSYQHAPSPTLRVPVAPKKDVATDTMIKVMVGQRNSPVFHVFELDYRLPKFAMYRSTDGRSRPAASHVTFSLKERASRVAQWVDQCFQTTLSNSPVEELSVSFESMRDGRLLQIQMSSTGQVMVSTDDMEVAGEVVQDMCAFLGVQELESQADFPVEFEQFRGVLIRVDDYNATRLRLTTEMADSTNTVKMLVIRAEDARILADCRQMRQMYGQLRELNRDLIAEHTKRATNHQELLNALKEVNQMIQKAARLRVGQSKSRIVAACRAAIKNNNLQNLFTIMEKGA